MADLREGWRIQVRVVGALIVRELTTRFGRENIGFLWIVVEPLMFATLVGFLWRVIKGPEEHGINIFAFVATGYIPLTLFRLAVARSAMIFTANAGLLYHKQVKVLDFVLVRFLIEMLGATTAYIVILVIYMLLGVLPMPADVGELIGGWLLYCLFVFSLCLILAPLSEMSDILEKIIPVAMYVMIPFSGTFTMASWFSPGVRGWVLWSAPADTMEIMREGVFGENIQAYYSVWVPLATSLVMMAVGLLMCRRVRRNLVIE